MIKIPHLGDLQYAKNPFTKPHIHSVFIIARSKSLNERQELTPLKSRAKTIYHEIPKKFPRPDSIMIPSHNQPPSEIGGDSITEDYDWISESIHDEPKNIDEEEIKITEKELDISPEIEHNFYVMTGMRPATETEIGQREVSLKLLGKSKRSTNKTLLLDLDDTLVHTINTNFDYSMVNIDYNRAKTVIYKDDNSLNFTAIKVIVRPYAVKFLEELSKIYEIIVTA